tara:strand:+ start:300 stop:776 length:477 start_codon:yes stop_codon:yes gene_type:complete
VGKHIAIGPVVDFRGKAIKLPKRDDDGDVDWETGTQDEDKTPENLPTESATTLTLLREVLLGLQASPDLRGIQRAEDSRRAMSLWNSMERCEDGTLEVHDKVYEWLHRLLKRDIPISKEEKDAGLEPLSVASRLYSLNAWTVIDQLKDVDDRKDPDDD